MILMDSLGEILSEFQNLNFNVFEKENKVKCQVCYDCLTRSDNSS